MTALAIMVLLTLCPPMRRKPCTMISAGGSMPAAMHMAGHHTQWNFKMSLPMRWWAAPHHAEKSSPSSP